jgi:hypothetical protein
MGAVVAINNAIREAIVAGHQQYTVAAQVGRIKAEFPADIVAWRLDKSKQDLYRHAGIELLMTREEIDARYEYREQGPRSVQWEEDEDGNDVLVPLERADYCGYTLLLYPRRRPLPGAVYVARQPIEGDTFSMAGMQRAFRAIVDAHGDDPRELRLHAANYTDFCNLLVGMRHYLASGAGGDGVTFNGVPVKPQPRAPLMMLLAVYPLPGIGD